MELEEQLLFIIQGWKVKPRSLLSKGQRSVCSKDQIKGMAFTHCSNF